MFESIKLPTFRLDGKTAIVTGASKGIGFAIAYTYALNGANVVITSRSKEDVAVAAQLIRNAGGRCFGFSADSSKQEDVRRVIAETVNSFGQLDILVNNAGIGGKTAPILMQQEQDFMRVIDTNLKGVFLFAQSAAEQMVSQGTGGKIINMASVGGFIGGKNVAPYGASKAGVISLTKTMANEWARYGITVNAICPGYVITAINADVFADPEVKSKMEKRTAVRRLGSVEEIAGPALALASDCFSYMTGTTISIDGGQTIGG